MEGKHIRAVEAGAVAGRHFRYFDLVMAAFVTILLLSNVIGAGKIASVDVPGIGANRLRARCVAWDTIQRHKTVTRRH